MQPGINLTLLIGPTLPIPAPIPIIEAIQSLEVTNTDQGRDGFQITFAIGRRTSSSSDVLDYQLTNNLLLRPFNRIIIIVTFGVVQKVLIDGIITHQQLNPSNEPGQSTLTLTGEDVSVMMDMEEKSVTHPNQPDIAIVSKIILSYARYGLTPNIIPPDLLDVPLMLERIPSQQSTDLAYILKLSRIHDYIFYIEPTSIPGVNKAFWIPRKLAMASLPQKALSVNMGPETNVTSINFQYNALTPNMISGTIQVPFIDIKVPISIFTSLRPSLSSLPAWLVNQPNVRSIKLRNTSGLNLQQTLSQGQAEVDQSMDAVTASGEIDTARYGDILRVRKLVGLRGAGHTYDGLYYVKSVTHNIKRGEYRQSFTLTREGLGSAISRVQP
jgi:hypothetical protein